MRLAAPRGVSRLHLVHHTRGRRYPLADRRDLMAHKAMLRPALERTNLCVWSVEGMHVAQSDRSSVMDTMKFSIGKL